MVAGTGGTPGVRKPLRKEGVGRVLEEEGRDWEGRERRRANRCYVDTGRLEWSRRVRRNRQREREGGRG